MVIVLGTIVLESEAEATRLTEALVARAARSRADAGNLDYAFSRGLEDGREIRLTEIWESEALLMAHLQIPDPAFNEALASARITSAKVTAYDGANARVLMQR
ncbi:MAG: antibiotic biosynthesis monooxygenase [Gammaproteobacteria bacterium]|jgi:quinol monooxygenase YgiN|nr:antibiotic biosynthesis monooxygenase [Gammaproteobacteria bacterium]